ncbi:unnamed protein product [Meganyctiphanes norvegica]|uniref:Uncharacterized protein n=1 Tax=Meganyctiphanes norvegica TaxID=48144 RepID=A0AAV2S2H2_MEGNR
MYSVFISVCVVALLSLDNASPQIYTKLWPHLKQTGSVAIHYPALHPFILPGPVVVPGQAAVVPAPADLPDGAPRPTTYHHGGHHGKRWRSDGRCGSKTNPDGEHHVFRTYPGGPIAECDPDSNSPCCSSYGYCGHGTDVNGYSYCNCHTCEDYSWY